MDSAISSTHNRFPNLGIWQRDWEAPGSLTLEASGIWLQNLHRTRETDSWRAQTKHCVHTRTQEQGAVTPQELSQACLSVSRSLWQRCGLAVACCRVGGTECSSAWAGPFEEGCHYLHHLDHSLATGQTRGRGHSSTHQQKIGLKICWAGPHPSEQDLVSPIRKIP